MLTVLNLYNNRIGIDGAIAIAEALKSGSSVLKKCDLRYNEIGSAEEMLRDAVKGRDVELLV